MKWVRSDESLGHVRWVASGCYIATKLIEAVSKFIRQPSIVMSF